MRDRLEIWREICRRFQPYEDLEKHDTCCDLIEELGYDELCLDYFYNGAVASIVVKELERERERQSENE